MRWRLLMAVSLTALLGAATFAGWAAQHRAAPAPLAKLTTSTAYVAPAFALRDQSGRTVTPASLKGHVTLLAFVDPVCTSICPILGRQLASIAAAVPRAQAPAVVLVSVAPHRTPSQAQAFAAHAGLAPGWRFLLGPGSQLAPTWKAFHVTVVPSTGDVLHDGAVVVLDRQAQVRDEYYAPFPSGLLISEVKSLSSA